MFHELGVRRALLLQGPMGPFFARLAEEMRHVGIEVTKVNFNAGDALYFPRGVPYRGAAKELPAFLSRLFAERAIDAVFLFGDGRPHHRIAIEVARRAGVAVYVFEEGYLRPDWITLEQGGVNGHSSLPRDPAFYRALPEVDGEPKSSNVGPTFRRAAWYSTVYSIAMTLGFWLYRRYRHHRPLNAWMEAIRWVRSGARKLLYARREHGVLEWLVRDHHHQYFLVALQVHCDYQLAHSAFSSVESFIERVAASFAAHASPTDLLVVKHHPMDRAYRDYGPLIRRLRVEHGLGDRLVYVHDLHLPTMLRHAKGAVMINSTVGLQSIQYGTPVKVLGHAIYDMTGLTSQASLDDFWKNPGSVDAELFRNFRRHLLLTNQSNGSFYKPLCDVTTPTGVRWVLTARDGHSAPHGEFGNRAGA